jgi:outer membrane protein assembly factor BamB
MDEVPVANTNPVSFKVTQKEPDKNKSNKESQLIKSLKNLVYMTPPGVVVLLLVFYLGSNFGKFTTLPYTSFTTFAFFISIAVLLFFLQLLLRSMVFSTLAGICLVSGIFYAWFGDFHRPIIENLQSIGMIVQSAWTRRDIPFPLLMSGIMTFTIAGVAIIQFFVSLFVKSFFETFFGRDWGDGKWMGFVGAIALLIGVHLGFYIYSSNASNVKNKLHWKIYSRYRPIEKYLTPTPGSMMIGREKIYTSHNGRIRSISLEDGKILEEKTFKASVIRPEIEFTTSPVFFGENDMVCYNKELNLVKWSKNYPNSFPKMEIDGDQKNAFIPLTSFPVDSGKKLLVYYDYGYIGMYNLDDGELLWLKSIDRKAPAKRRFSENFPDSNYFFESNKIIVFSCDNAIVKAVNKTDGEVLWQYSHVNPKHRGKPQKGFISGQQDRVLVSFKTGEMMTLALENGRVIYQAKNDSFSFLTVPMFKGLEASFLTQEGFYYVVEVDGGKILYSCNLLPKMLDFLPVAYDLEKGIIAHKDEVLRITKKKFETILKVSNRVFVTHPVFDDKIMYIGTQDGWIYCVHIGSRHEKWRIHVDGELDSNSLAISGGKLIVRTRSDSIFAINRWF